MRVQKRWRARFALALIGLAAAAIGCALGDEQEPGCHGDGECGGGFVCRAGACFRDTAGDAGAD